MDYIYSFIFTIFILPFTMQEDLPKAVQFSCECAVFTRENEMILSRKLALPIVCDAEGEKKCENFCNALANSARESDPHIICANMNNTDVNNLHVAVYARACGNTEWKFTGLKTNEPICCRAGKSTNCK